MKLMINHQTHYQYTDQARNSIQYINSINIENSRITLVTFEDGKARLDLLNY